MIDIERTQVGEVVVFTVSGRIDAINAPLLQNALQQVVENGSNDPIILRLADVNYLSAAALRVLRILKDLTGRVRIAEPSNRVREVMQITGLDAQYELYPAFTDALQKTRPIINAHTHLELGWLKKHCPDVTGADFAEWMDTGIRKPFRTLSVGWEQQFIEAATQGIQQMRAAGITTVGDISSTGLSIQPLLNAGMHGIVYIELLERDETLADQKLAAVQERIEKWRPKLRGGLKIGLSLHAPYTLHRTLWEKAIAYARTEHLPLCIHVAEHAAEVEYMQSGTGSFAEKLFQHSAPIDIPGVSPVAFLDDIGALELQPLLVHAVHVSNDDIARIKKYNCTVVHCPRSNLRLQCGRMPLEKFLAADIPVMLGTDSLASSPSLNVFEEVEVAIALHYGKVSPKDIVKMVHGTLPGYSSLSP